jgi:ketosteroid isomerase-like protein
LVLILSYDEWQGAFFTHTYRNMVDHLSDEEHIRTARANCNAAIARQDVEAIASFWTDDIHVTGSTGVRLSGIPANCRFYTQQFARRPDTNYVRTPSTVQVMDAWKVAMELGDWVGTWTEPDGAVQVAGHYMAQWLLVGTRWRIHGELYVPTSCAGGAICARHPVRG